MKNIRNIFYCPECKKLEINFEFDERKQREQITWVNSRDGWGRPICHIVCPHCGYELSGYMFVLGMIKNDDDKEDIIQYVKYTIEGYSDGSYCDTKKLLEIIRKDRKTIK